MTVLAWVILAYAAILAIFAGLFYRGWQKSLEGWDDALDLVATLREFNSALISSLLKSLDEPADEFAAKRKAK